MISDENTKKTTIKTNIEFQSYQQNKIQTRKYPKTRLAQNVEISDFRKKTS